MKYAVKIETHVHIPDDCRLQCDMGVRDEEHPYGQWTVRLSNECIEVASIDAPSATVGDVLQLYRGIKCIGTATIMEVM